MWRRCRIVTPRIGAPHLSSIVVPFRCLRIGSTCFATGSSSDTTPFSTSCSTAGPVNIFVVLPQT
jgi:hypothetical protein